MVCDSAAASLGRSERLLALCLHIFGHQAGQPVLTIEATAQPWLSFNVREDRLDDLAIGAKVDLALAGYSERFAGIVAELLPLGDYAVWQAARAVGDHDRNTLRVRVDRPSGVPALEPGMTVRLVQSTKP